jgi:hydroxyacylglutathione hydrolase
MAPVDVNTYVAACPATGACAVIDPGNETDRIVAVIGDNGYAPRYIINTHGHHDHTSGNAALKAVLGVPVARYPGSGATAPIDIPLADGDIIPLGDLRFTVIHTPGHIPDAVCLLLAGHLFTGDTLFVGDVGRSDLPGGDFNGLIASLEKLVSMIPEETIILPGHDYGDTPASTMHREKRENPYITDFITDP